VGGARRPVVPRTRARDGQAKEAGGPPLGAEGDELPGRLVEDEATKGGCGDGGRCGARGGGGGGLVGVCDKRAERDTIDGGVGDELSKG